MADGNLPQDLEIGADEYKKAVRESLKGDGIGVLFFGHGSIRKEKDIETNGMFPLEIINNYGETLVPKSEYELLLALLNSKEFLPDSSNLSELIPNTDTFLGLTSAEYSKFKEYISQPKQQVNHFVSFDLFINPEDVQQGIFIAMPDKTSYFIGIGGRGYNLEIEIYKYNISGQNNISREPISIEEIESINRMHFDIVMGYILLLNDIIKQSRHKHNPERSIQLSIYNGDAIPIQVKELMMFGIKVHIGSVSCKLLYKSGVYQPSERVLEYRRILVRDINRLIFMLDRLLVNGHNGRTKDSGGASLYYRDKILNKNDPDETLNLEQFKQNLEKMLMVEIIDRQEAGAEDKFMQIVKDENRGEDALRYNTVLSGSTNENGHIVGTNMKDLIDEIIADNPEIDSLLLAKYVPSSQQGGKMKHKTRKMKHKTRKMKHKTRKMKHKTRK